MYLQDKLEKMRQMVNKLESERRMLKEDLGKYENRATQMEVHRMSLEGDLQRLQMIIQEKEGTILVYVELDTFEIVLLGILS